MPVRFSEFEREMQHLEAEIKKLEAEYNMFFAGRLSRLPWETRARVAAMVKRYDRTPIRNTAERFRFGSLQARYASFCELWEKTLKAKEEGRVAPGRSRSHAHPVAKAADKKKDREQLVYEAHIRDPNKDNDHVKELYHQLAEAREKTGEPQIPFHRFTEVVRAQVQKLGGSGSDVSFRVAVTDGKVKLTVKAVE